MNYELKGESPFPLALLHLDRGESIQIEAGAMLYHNGHVTLEGHMNSNGKKGLGGLVSALGRKMTSGESFFITTATGTDGGGELAIAPGNPGPIIALPVDDAHQWRLNTGAFLATDSSAGYQMVRQKTDAALLGGTGGFYIMETHGTGTMLISAYGDLLPVDIAGDDYIIDNSHVVAWDRNLDYTIEAASGSFGYTTGEGYVNHFTGRGRVYIQTRNVEALANLMQPYLPSGSD